MDAKTEELRAAHDVLAELYAASDAVNAEILLRLRRATRSIPSSTLVGGHLAIRPCFTTPAPG